MKRASLLVLLLLLAARPASALIIVEVQIAGDQANHDYVRIYNDLDREIDVSGYRLRKKSSTGKDYSLRLFPKGTLIGPQDYLTWANSQEGFAEKLEADLSSAATLSVNNSIALISPEGEVISALAWGQGNNQYQEGRLRLPNPEPHQQIKRKLVNEKYQDSQSNYDDFYLTERPASAQASSVIEPAPLRRQSSSWFGLILAAVAVSLSSVKIFNVYYQKKLKQS